MKRECRRGGRVGPIAVSKVWGRCNERTRRGRFAVLPSHARLIRNRCGVSKRRCFRIPWLNRRHSARIDGFAVFDDGLDDGVVIADTLARRRWRWQILLHRHRTAVHFLVTPSKELMPELNVSRVGQQDAHVGFPLAALAIIEIGTVTLVEERLLLLGRIDPVP